MCQKHLLPLKPFFYIACDQIIHSSIFLSLTQSSSLHHWFILSGWRTACHQVSCSFIPFLLSPPSFTYGGRFCSHLHFNNSEKRGLVYSFTSIILPSCAFPPPPCLFSCVFSCLLQLEAYSLVVHEERFFKNGHKGCQGQEGGHSVIDCRDLWPAPGTGRVAPRPCAYSRVSATAC